jgi:Bacterial regulatory protein, Fis family
VCNGAIAGDGRRNKEITSQLSSTTKVSVSLRMTARSTTFCNSRIFPGGPLAARASGIPLLVEYFVGHFAKESGKSVRHIGKQTLGQLQAYRANLKKHPPKRGVSALDDREMEMIEAALAETHGRIPGPTGAAAKLGISRQTLESKIRRLGIDKYGPKRFTPQCPDRLLTG